jgi:hypothetical protein
MSAFLLKEYTSLKVDMIEAVKETRSTGTFHPSGSWSYWDLADRKTTRNHYLSRATSQAVK